MTNSNYTHLALIVDRSGSMRSIQDPMETGIKSLLAEQSKEPGELHVDITVFDTEVNHLFTDVRVDDVKKQIIDPRGMTALNDAIGMTVARLGERLSAMDEAERPGHVIVVIVTDGLENASREYTTKQVSDMVTRQKDEFNWHFRFLGTDIDSFTVAGSYSIGRSETINFSRTAKGASNVSVVLNSSLSATRAGASGAYSDEDRASAMATDD